MKNSKFVHLEIIERWKKANPLVAHQLGIHDYDGELPNFSPTHIAKRIQEIQEDLEFLNQLNIKDDKLLVLEHELIVAKLTTELYQLRELKQFENNPMTYCTPLSVVESSYTKRAFAPIETRVQSIISFEEKIPHYLKQAIENLEPELPSIRIKIAADFLGGVLPFYKDKLIDFVTQVDNLDLIDRWSQVNIDAINAMEKFLEQLNSVYLPRAHENFALGEEKFLKLLKYTEFVDTTTHELLEIGERELRENLAEQQVLANKYGLQELIAKTQADHPEPDRLIDAGREILKTTRQFLIDKDLVNIPTDEQCEVISTPDFMKARTIGAMNAPGPFEPKEASQAYMYITTPDFEAGDEAVQRHMNFFNYSFLHTFVAHEAWPGHYLQLLYSNTSKSDIMKMFARSIAMIEGWGLYCEEMMYQQGYDYYDRDLLKMGQLLASRARIGRLFTAVNMHCKGMSMEDAKKMLIEKVQLPEFAVDIMVQRGTVNPMFLNYTLGKVMIKKLRVDYEKERGEDYSLKKFHNEMLSYASPPINILRKVLLENPDAYSML